MRHIFIVNPAAGPKNAYGEIKSAIEKYNHNLDYAIYVTTCPLDATKYVHTYCDEHSEPVRFYACGGDGTLNEVVNGAAGYGHAEVACYPCGSGDDFVKYYGGKDRFLNLKNNIEGKAESIDLMKVGDRYSINVINFGFDGVVAKTISKVKRKFLIGGKNSYTTGIIRALFHGMKNKCVVHVDGEQINDKEMLLCTVSNGSHVGGSFKCAPHSKNNDGLIEICLVKTLSIFTFIKLINDYREGKHLDNPKFKKYISYRQGKSIKCEAKEKDFAISVDGEMIDTDRFTVDILPKALKFVVPKAAAIN